MRQPNIIIMYMDNLGYGDLACYGHPVHRTPNLDRMAEEGMRLTSFYSTSGVCTPSRTSLLTGCYPRRVNMHCGDQYSVLMPISHKGLHPNEITLATLLKGHGYATCCVGKWHLGDQDPFLPTRHGFDHWLGAPYSEDMVPRPGREHWPPLPLMRNDEVIEAPVDRDFLTRRYTEEAVGFIREHRDEPFFLYLPHAMPGSSETPFVSPEFSGRSENGIYGDCVEELDWSAGEVLRTLEELDLDEDTLVIWSSDNGAVYHEPQQGSNAPLRGWGYNTSEGGQRMPCIIRWPGRVPAGVVSDALTSTMDILPTVARIVGGEPPQDRIIDGQDMRELIFGGDYESAYDELGFFYYQMDQLQAVRSGPWKLYLALDAKLDNTGGRYENAKPCPRQLFNLDEDIHEDHEVAAKHPEVVARLEALAEAARVDLGDHDRPGANQRPCGMVDAPEPQLLA